MKNGEEEDMRAKGGGEDGEREELRERDGLGDSKGLPTDINPPSPPPCW